MKAAKVLQTDINTFQNKQLLILGLVGDAGRLLQLRRARPRDLAHGLLDDQREPVNVECTQDDVDDRVEPDEERRDLVGERKGVLEELVALVQAKDDARAEEAEREKNRKHRANGVVLEADALAEPHQVEERRAELKDEEHRRVKLEVGAEAENVHAKAADAMHDKAKVASAAPADHRDNNVPQKVARRSSVHADRPVRVAENRVRGKVLVKEKDRNNKEQDTERMEKPNKALRPLRLVLGREAVIPVAKSQSPRDINQRNASVPRAKEPPGDRVRERLKRRPEKRPEKHGGQRRRNIAEQIVTANAKLGGVHGGWVVRQATRKNAK